MSFFVFASRQAGLPSRPAGRALLILSLFPLLFVDLGLRLNGLRYRADFGAVPWSDCGDTPGGFRRIVTAYHMCPQESYPILFLSFPPTFPYVVPYTHV